MRWLALILVVVAALIAAELFLRDRYRRLVLPPVTRAPGQVTLVALGDSIVAGAPGDPAVAWPAVLGEQLRRHYPAVTWRIVNAGVPGDTAPLGYARFERDVAAVDPQLVLIAFGLNDCNPARYGMDRWLEDDVPAGWGRSYLWQAIRRRVERLARRSGWLALPQPEMAGSSQPRTSPSRFGDALDALVARTRLIGGRPVLLTMTPLGDAAAEGVRMRAAIYPIYNRIIAERAAAGGVELIQLSSGAPADALEAIWGGTEAGFRSGRARSGDRPEHDSDSLLDNDGFHLTAAGQAWVAAEVFRQGEATGIWAQLAQEARP